MSRIKPEDVFKTEFENRDDLSKSSSENLRNGVALWASFYRENPHRFIMDYLGFNLYIFQQILVYAMDKSTLFCFIASRGNFLAPLCRKLIVKNREKSVKAKFIKIMLTNK